MTTDNPTAVPARGGARKAAAPRRGQQSSFRARRRRRNQLLAGGVIGLVVIIVAVVIAVGLTSSSSTASASTVSAAQLSAIESVTPAQMATAESGLKEKNPPVAVTGATPLTANGKPEVLYIGAEYCPYCAGERWSLVMALSKFGTWSNLRSTVSSPTDTVASVPTFTFAGSTFTSDLLAFTSVETQTVDGKPLQKTTPEQDALLAKYDGPPYTSAQAANGIPFVDLGNQSVQDGLGFNISSDQAMQHKSFNDVANQLPAQYSQISGDITAEAGILVSNLCQLTGGKDAVGGAACKAFPTAITQPPVGG